ncbi:MoxR family ATPase [Gottschalkiaceae bacterium SANA]|nr:MoxR family ATPase [Gottschalkiaceae bacterium SANA]
MKIAVFHQRMQENMQKVMVGKEAQITQVLTAFLCGGHILLEDVPGLGKTKLARSLSRSLNLPFARIQFTPDLLPSDITGVNVFMPNEGRFELRKGPLMTSFVLADEINRATPRTQSSLLEAMEESQVTIDGETHALGQPFFVIATQNPIETGGTFPLPEAQLDRFFMKLSLGYPSLEEEATILSRFEGKDPLVDLESVVGTEDILAAMKETEEVIVNDAVRNYILRLVHKTRTHSDLRMGVSPRGSLALFKGARAYAALLGRNYVLPDDVQALFVSVVAHRMILSGDARMRGKSTEDIANEIVGKESVPMEDTNHHVD